MNPEIAAKRLAAARQRLAAAQDLRAAHPDDAVARAYRAMAQAARAALAIEGVAASDEEDLFNRFRLHAGRAGTFDAGLLREFVDARASSHAVDYGDGLDRPAEKARVLVDAAERFVEEVDRLLRARLAAAAPAAPTRTGGSLPAASEITPEKAAMLQDLAAAFPGAPHLVRRYLETYGWGKVVAPNVRAVRAAAERDGEDGSAAEAPSAPEGEGLSPFYAAKIRCGFCEGEAFETQLLRSKSLQIAYEYLDPAFPLFVPSCGGTLRTYLPADPLLFEVHVCPHCLYASAALGNFHTDDAYARAKGLLHQLAARKIELLREQYAAQRAARAALAEAGGIVPGSAAARAFGADRTPAAARAALRLAALCAQVESEYNGNAPLLAAKWILGAARLAREAGDAAGERAHWKEALGLLETSFERTSRPGEALYLTGVLQHLLGMTQEARANLTRVVGDRGKLPDAAKFKRFAENLREDLKRTAASS